MKKKESTAIPLIPLSRLRDTKVKRAFMKLLKANKALAGKKRNRKSE